MWDQRSLMRSNELTALTQAIGIIKEGVATKTEQTIRFMQSEESFVQIKATQKKASVRSTKSFLSVRSPVEQAIELLRSRSMSSFKKVPASLSALMAHVSKDDPLAKVKKLIEELILRLQEEAKQEESHNGKD